MKILCVSFVILLSFSLLWPGAKADEGFARSVSGPPVSVLADSGQDQSREDCEGFLLNHDGSFENAYTWVFGGVGEPEFGAFAERFEGLAYLCEIQFYLTQIGNQAGQTMDVFIWQDDGTGNPGNVLLHIPNLDPGPIDVWPAVTRFDLPISLTVDGDWWIGWWGNWPGEQAGWLIAADENGPGGEPRTKIAPGIGYPTGWDHPGFIPSWSNARSLGIQIGLGEEGQDVDSQWGGQLSSRIHLESISPNPFRVATEIEFTNRIEGYLKLSVYNTEGRRLKTLHDGFVNEGNHHITWDGTNDEGLPAGDGVFYLRGDTGSLEVIKRIIRVR